MICADADVELHPLRFADGRHTGMGGLINVFDFPGDEPSIVCLENDFDIMIVSAVLRDQLRAGPGGQ